MHSGLGSLRWNCMGGDDGDNVKKEIKDCSSKSCTLWLVRPYK